MTWTVSSSRPPPAPATERLPQGTANGDPMPLHPCPRRTASHKSPSTHCKKIHYLPSLPHSHKPPFPVPTPLHTNHKLLSHKPTATGGGRWGRNRPPNVIKASRQTRVATSSTFTSPARSASTPQHSQGLSSTARRRWRSSAPVNQTRSTR